jgi:hypothetical protein
LIFFYFYVIINLKGDEKMKKYYQKNIFKCVFSALVIFLWGFTVNGIDPGQFKGDQKIVYDGLPPLTQEALIALSNSPNLSSKCAQLGKNQNFTACLCSIKDFLNLQTDSQIRNHLEFIIGVVFSNDGRIVVNTRHFGLITGKCKSSICGGFQSLGYYGSPKPDCNLTKRTFPWIAENSSEARQWSVRETSPILPTVNPNPEDPNPEDTDPPDDTDLYWDPCLFENS